MIHKYCKKRRLFLAQTSLQLGLIPAASLFSSTAYTQTSSTKKNVIFVFYNHGANLPYGDKTRNFLKGGFHFGKGSQISKMNSIAGDALFMRGVNNFLVGNGNFHPPTTHAVLTASRIGQAKSGADVIAGRALQKKYNSTIPYWTLAFNMHQGDDTVRNSDHPYYWQWRTVTFDGKKAVMPEISVSAAFKKMKNDLICAQARTPTSRSSKVDEEAKSGLTKEIKNLDLVSENLKYYKSSLLVPKSEIEKLETQIAKKKESKNEQLKALNSTDGRSKKIEDCSGMKNPRDSYNYNDSIVADLRRTLGRETYNNFHYKSQAFFDLMILAFKNNYTRSITYHTNQWTNQQHGNGAHKYINNKVTLTYLDQLSRTLNTLFVKLKNAGIYEETLVVLAGEYAHQNLGRGNDFNHRGDNIPYTIVNSGKSGEVNLKRPIHAGDVHCNIFNRLGIPINSFGTQHSQLKRVGHFKDRFFA